MKSRGWVEQQNKVTNAFLATLPLRDRFKARMTELYDYERFGVPRKKGAHYFYTRNSGLQNQSVLYVRDSVDGAGRVLIDPNGWSKDGATALAEWSPSEDGKLVTYAVQDGGTDWRTVKVIDVATGRILADELKWLKFGGGVEWAKDNSGFYYSRFPEPAAGQTYQASSRDQKVYFHKLGTAAVGRPPGLRHPGLSRLWPWRDDQRGRPLAGHHHLGRHRRPLRSDADRPDQEERAPAHADQGLHQQLLLRRQRRRDLLFPDQ